MTEMQAHAFQAGLQLSPNDKVLRQGFWDAISLISQSRVDVQLEDIDADFSKGKY